MRHPVLMVTATAVCLAVLTGCDGVNRSAPSAVPAVQTAVQSDFDPAEAVAKASKEPYAVSVRTTSAPDRTTSPPTEMVITARQNLNTVNTGRQERQFLGKTAGLIFTADAEYHRADHDGEPGTWTKMPKRHSRSEFDLTGYAQALLSQGPAVRKGKETRDGVPVHHLSGHLSLEQLDQISPEARQYDGGRGDIRGVDLDQWIDAQGRTRYVEKRTFLDGTPVVVTMAFSDFGPPETIDPPIATTV